MKVLLTGGTGFVGTALVEALREHGHTPTLLTRPRSKPPTNAASIPWDIEVGPPPAAAWEETDAVINLAGEPLFGRWTAAKKDRIKQSRVGTTSHLVAGMAALERKPSQLISVSAIGYYGDRGDETLTEDATAGHDFLAAVCREWEAAAMSAEPLGVTVARTRFGIVLGKDGGALDPLNRLGKLGLLGPIGGGKQWWSWVHIADVVGFMIHALENQLSGPFNLVAPDGRRQRDWVATAARVLHRPGFLPAPAFAVRAAVGGFAAELLSSRHVIPAATQASGFEFAFPDLEPALQNAFADD
ncbi:MAG: TIGR01777 family oxidoreductase [Actinobacteria bacterium]|nr:TIGR01777 family oxidoreductase [Actinomycetota bacterium]